MSISVKPLYAYQLCFYFQAPVTAKSVKLTGEFDHWEQKHEMRVEKIEGDVKNFVFELPITEPRMKKKFVFKFVIDGAWLTSNAYSTEYDICGNSNNVIYYGKDSEDCPCLTKELISTNEDLVILQELAKKYIQKDSAIEVEKEEKEKEETLSSSSNMTKSTVIGSSPMIAQTPTEIPAIKMKRKGCSIKAIFSFFQRKSKSRF